MNSVTDDTFDELVIKAEKPVIVDFYTDMCQPCKMMAPILEELKEEYAGKLDIVFIDVWENPDGKKGYNISTNNHRNRSRVQGFKVQFSSTK